jgi:hypothetical protein
MPSDGFGVRMGGKLVAQLLKFRPQVAMIIDFTIEHNSRFAAILKNGLIATLKINYFETSCTERKQIGGENALLVGTTVEESRHHVPNPFL